MSNYKRKLVIENGMFVTLQDSTGLSTTFSTFAECKKYTGVDLTGKFYVGYEPEINFYQDSKNPLISNKDIPCDQYEQLIAKVQTYIDRMSDPYYGMSDTEKKQQLLINTLDAVDKKTDVLIATGWVYPDASGQSVRMLDRDQANFEGEKNLYVELADDGADVSSYFPVEIKVQTSANGAPIMLTMADLTAYKTFVRAGKMYIKGRLQEGWVLKNQLVAMSLSELENWVDPR